MHRPLILGVLFTDKSSVVLLVIPNDKKEIYFSYGHPLDEVSWTQLNLKLDPS